MNDFHKENWSHKMYVVTTVFNPHRYDSRYRLYKEFEKHISDLGATLITVEVAFGERSFVVTQANNPHHVQLRTGGFEEMASEIWIKENAINLGIARIPKEVRYIAWVDADVRFTRADVFEEAIHILQSRRFCQLFSHAQDLTPHHEPHKNHQASFCYNWVNHNDKMDFDNKKYSSGVNGHPGYAWCCTRTALDQVGGLIDWAILGSADRHMAYALVDKVEASYHPDVHPEYKKMCKIWQVRARLYCHRSISYVPGLITHGWHGGKHLRGYSSRWKILVEEAYNPELDTKKDSSGLIVLTERNYRLRDKISKYFKSRVEDDIRVD